jgi:hypothetical protein
MRGMRLRAASILLLLPMTAVAAELPTTDTPVGHLAVPVVPDSMVVSPDSSRLAYGAKEGDATLLEKGISINPESTDPRNDSARAVRLPIHLVVDDKSTIAFDTMTQAVFSPNSKRVGFAGQHDKTWQLVLDGKTLTSDAEDVPPVPIVFSPDSAHTAWAVRKGDRYLVTVDDRKWPALEANDLGRMVFSPDSQHLAAVAHVGSAWKVFVDGQALATPGTGGGAATTPATGPASRAGAGVPRMERFGQLAWRPDSSGVAFYAGLGGMSWVLFSQGLDGTVGFTSKPFEGTAKQAPAVSTDGRHVAVAYQARNKWWVLSDREAAGSMPATARGAGGLDGLLLESVRFYEPTGAGDGAALIYLGQQNKKWRLYADDRAGQDTFDAIVLGTFVVSPDRHHYVFAGTRGTGAMGRGGGSQAVVIKDGAVLATHDECGASTFAFSPDSQHVAYAARNGPSWFACVDGKPGAPFNMMTGAPVAFSPDSTRVAYAAMTAAKSWHLVVGQEGGLQSKGYEGFLKGSHVAWRADGTVVTIAIEKKVAMRVEARP